MALLVLLSMAARLAGMPEGPGGLLLGSLLAGILVTLAMAMAHRSGVLRVESLAWGLALLLVTEAPILASVYPGEQLAMGTLAREGDVLDLGPAWFGSVLVSVTADVPEGGSLAFLLQAGTLEAEGELSHSTRRWSAGEEHRHYHEDRASVLVRAEIPQGRPRVVLARTSMPGTSIRIVVYAERVPNWLLAAAALCTLLAFAWRMSPFGGSREIQMAASVAVVMGLGAGALATPTQAMGAVIKSLLLGLLVGMPLGAALGSMLARVRGWLRRSLTRQARSR